MSRSRDIPFGQEVYYSYEFYRQQNTNDTYVTRWGLTLCIVFDTFWGKVWAGGVGGEILYGLGALREE